MPSPRWSPSGILTIVSLVALCIISFIVVLGSDNIVDTHPIRDIVYSFPKRNLYTPRHRRAFQHHGRAPAPFPQAFGPAVSNVQTNPTLAISQATSSLVDPLTAKSPTSPSPSPSLTSDPKNQSPAPSSPPPSEQSHVTSAASATPTSPPASSLSPAAAPTSTPASASQSASSPNVQTPSNAASNSATNNVYSNQQPSITFLGSISTPENDLPNPTTAKSVVYAQPTTGATAKGFFANKGAVGVVFGIVGLVFVLAAVIGGRMILNRYRSSYEEREVEEFFEKYSVGGHTIEDDHHHGGSAPDVFANAGAMTHAAPDAYPDRSVHYGGPGSTIILPPSVDFGIPYPPSAAGASIQHSVPSSDHPFAAAANASYPTGAPPVTYGHSHYYGQAQEIGAADPYHGYDEPVNMGYAQ